MGMSMICYQLMCICDVCFKFYLILYTYGSIFLLGYDKVFSFKSFQLI